MMLQLKTSKSCDECKSRKVRCVKTLYDDTSCNSCKKRGTSCHFGHKKKRAKRAQPALNLSTDGQSIFSSSTAPSDAGIGEERNYPLNSEINVLSLECNADPTQGKHQEMHQRRLYIDRLLEDRSTSERRRNESSIVKANDQYVGSSGIAFFSDQKIASISDRLGHRKLRDLLESLSNSINSRMNHNDNHQAATIKFNAPLCGLQISEESTKLYVTAYFDHIHPIYPFLDRQTFERKVFQGDLALLLQDSPPFSALYYSVLALGSQYHGSGSFEPGRGTSWKFFQAALGLFPEILIPKETLVNVQAVISMAIFARNSSCVQIGDMLTAEAARMAQSLGLNRAICDSENISVSQRTFWVIYILEKTLSFACGRSSILIDSDIGTPVPEAPEANFGKFDWFYSVCRFSRLISKAYDALFSISATLLSTNSIKSTIDNSNHELECWRKAIPEDFRPGSPLRHLCDLDKASIAITLRVHCHYYSVVIALTRLRLSLPEAASSCPATDDKEVLLNACRAIIELTKYIDLATYTPIWILVSVPISATFILFDFIIHDPTHDKTKSNLSLLGIAAGYFCSLEYVSGGALQTSLLSDIAHIARDYIHSVDRSDVVRRTDSIFEVGSSQHTDATRTELQTPVSIDTGGQNLMGGMFTGHMNMDEPFYPADTLLSPLGNRLPEGIDLMDLFSTALPDGIYSFE